MRGKISKLFLVSALLVGSLVTWEPKANAVIDDGCPDFCCDSSCSCTRTCKPTGPSHSCQCSALCVCV
jgi:hypothetical protein